MSIRRTMQGLREDAAAADATIANVTTRVLEFGRAGVKAVQDIDGAVSAIAPGTFAPPIQGASGGLLDASGRPVSGSPRPVSGGSGGAGGAGGHGGFVTAGDGGGTGGTVGTGGGGSGDGNSFRRIGDAARETTLAVRTLDSRSAQVQAAMLSRLTEIRDRLDRSVDLGLLSRAD
jgi:hypothetical protein